MSGKFMTVKKIFIPTITAILIASQLTGCAAASESEMLTMINNQQAICIEVAVPKEVEQGEELTYDWTELAYLDNYEDFRLNFDDLLNITAFGEGGKNGTIYVDLEGNHTNNSTFYYAMMNKKFRAQINDTDTNAALVDLAYNNYVDVDSDAEAKLAYLNAYFNILEDAEPNYYNGNSAVTRAEFLSAVYRAGNPVTNLEENLEFTAKVDPAGDNEHTIFAQQMLDYSYLNFSEKSMNAQTFGGDITRAEAIYTLVQMFYADEYSNVTGKEAAFTDTKNGGDIASKQKFIETDRKTKETTYKDYWMSYELQYAINNPDGGMPESLYKAMVVAKQVGLVTSEESRWDEALTKNEALNFILRVYENMETVTNADRGNATGEVVDAPATENTETSTSGVDSTGHDVLIDEGDYVEPSIEELEQADSGYSAATQTALNNLKSAYDLGYMTEEQYNDRVERILSVEESQNNPSSSSNSSGYGQIQLTPEQQAAAEAMYVTDEEANQVINEDIQYGQGDYAGLEHIRIN